MIYLEVIGVLVLIYLVEVLSMKGIMRGRSLLLGQLGNKGRHGTNYGHPVWAQRNMKCTGNLLN